jgi:dTDP-glucose 4,6-dehydratase
VLDFACTAGALRFLYISSGAVYGPQPSSLEKIPESYNGAPPTNTVQSVYGQAKRLAEQLCTSYCVERELSTVVARCFAFVGEHIPLNGPYAIGNLIRDAMHNDRLLVRGDGTAVRSYLYGRDMAHWLISALTFGEAGDCFNIGSDEPINIANLATLVAQCIAPEKPVVIERIASVDNSRSVYVPDISKAKSLGLKVEISLENSIKETALRLFRKK